MSNDTSNGPKKISELPVVNTAAQTDSLIVLSSNTTSSIEVSNLFKNIPGPFAADANAASSNVAVGQLYYNTTGGVQIRLT